MSLLMQALKKAEDAKQKQAGLPERGAPVSAEVRDTQPLAFSEIDLLPLDDVPAGAQVDGGTSSALGKLDLSAELPDIDLPAALELVAADPLETAAAETRLEPAAGGVHADLAPSESAQDSTSQAPMPFPTVPPAAAWTESVATLVPAPMQQPHTETIPPRVTASRKVEPQREPQREPSVEPRGEPRIAAQRETQVGDDKRAVAQQQAKNVFASKAAPGPRPYVRYLSIAGATLLVAALGGAAWYMTADQFIAPPVMAQMEPAPAQEPPMPADAPVAAPSDAPGAVPAVEAHAATGNVQPAAAAVATIAAATAVTAAPATATTAATPAVVPDAVRNPQVPAPVPAQAETAAYTVETAGIQIRRSTDTRQVLSATSQAYQAFLAGEYQAAEQLYRRSLQQEPHSRDALLGLATLALKREQPEQAAGYFSRLLDADPADPDAIAGLLSLQQGDVAQDESRLKKALAQHPQSGALHFALGNLYAQQSRWGEAQQAYFRAFANAPGNADYAFNLGVSLDRLSQPRLALDYYRKALQFAANGTKGFQEAAVRDRIRALQEVVEQ